MADNSWRIPIGTSAFSAKTSSSRLFNVDFDLRSLAYLPEIDLTQQSCRRAREFNEMIMMPTAFRFRGEADLATVIIIFIAETLPGRSLRALDDDERADAVRLIRPIMFRSRDTFRKGKGTSPRVCAGRWRAQRDEFIQF
jgi:hypothetical protein